MRNLGVATLVAAVGLTVSGCGADHEALFSEADSQCDTSLDTFQLADDGTAITLSLGDDWDGQMVTAAEMSGMNLRCLERELEVPGSVMSKIEGTTERDGVRTAEADGLAYEWTFNETSGLYLTVTS